MNVLAIAGFDPSGGGGIARDLATFARFGVRGQGVLSAVTAQNSARVDAVEPVAPAMLRAQLETLLDDITPRATKTGMLAGSETAGIVAEFAAAGRLGALVVDPVLRSTSGASLGAGDLALALREKVLPHAVLVTPNLQEAAVLGGQPVETPGDMEAVGRDLCRAGARAVLVKGGHLEGDPVDVLVSGGTVQHLRGARIPVPEVRGTGCALSAAVAACLAQGATVPDAVVAARAWLRAALEAAAPLGSGAWHLGEATPPTVK